MTLTKSKAAGLATTRSLLRRLIEMPDLARTIPALPTATFAALIREVGVEDAGELVALATTEQLVQSFDEDLFRSERAGEREAFDVGRFAVWLEVLLEAGDDVAAARVAELDEDFVAHALSGIVLVFEEDALRECFDEADEDEARSADKALESALTEDIDGYVLVAKRHDGWDAALALILALDRDHRALLVRLLDRLAAVARPHLDDLAELSTVLSEAESLAEDVEAAREERRGLRGFVEARAARGFLALAREPSRRDTLARDATTRAYFRDLERHTRAANLPSAQASTMPALPAAVQRELSAVSELASDHAMEAVTAAPTLRAFTDALSELSALEPELFGERMEEIAYVTNVLLAGHEHDGRRLKPKEAADAALATVAFGAVVDDRARRPAPKSGKGGRARRPPPTRDDFVAILRARSVDVLFRVASHALATGAAPRVPRSKKDGLLLSPEALEAALG